MPTQIKISKEMILDAAFSIVREYGIEKLSNRELANKLKCSIRPIYYQFKNVEEFLKQDKVKLQIDLKPALDKEKLDLRIMQ